MNIASFSIICVIVTFTPGPTNIVILSTVHNSGTKKAVEFASGAAVAVGILVGLSAVLNSILMPVIPKILVVMRIVGSLYILYLAYQIFKMDASRVGSSDSGGFASGFLMQFVNPKVILFTITVIPAFVLPYYNDPFSVSIFALSITIIGTCALSSWVLFGMILKSFLQKYQKPVNIIMASFLVYSAAAVSGVF
ncbi:MAG: LysE family transporter [Desulfobacteraceae bacterium]|nr:LysE family transporter [Desulfobacteraceae bacterium]